MKATASTTKLFSPKFFVLSLLISIPLILIVVRRHSLTLVDERENPLSSSSTTVKQEDIIPDLKIRSGYASYDSYIQRQLNKTLNPELRKRWKTRDWDRKIQVFSSFFQDLKQKNLLSNESKALCVGARMGQEVEALKRVGVSDSIGLDLVPSPPLVMQGDFHSQPFKDGTFDFEFSNVFDHALYPHKFVGEIERTLKPGGICVLHVALSKGTDKYSANDLYSVGPLKKLFTRSGLVHVRTIDGFGLDTEVVFKKKE